MKTQQQVELALESLMNAAAEAKATGCVSFKPMCMAIGTIHWILDIENDASDNFQQLVESYAKFQNLN